MSALDARGTSASAAAVFSSPLAIWVPVACKTLGQAGGFAVPVSRAQGASTNRTGREG